MCRNACNEIYNYFLYASQSVPLLFPATSTSFASGNTENWRYKVTPNVINRDSQVKINIHVDYMYFMIGERSCTIN